MTKNKIAGFDRTEVLAPLVIGVTGHRDLREETVPQLEQKIKEIFLQLHKDYPATPLVLISALAEGADRLAADVALSPQLGVRLIVPLPMPIDLYEQDFDRVSVLETPLGAVVVEDSTREEFRALLGRAANCFVLNLAEGNTLQSISRPGPERDRQYEVVGRYIAQQSQILIALWDGVESDRVGGTASVVRYQREGVPADRPLRAGKSGRISRLPDSYSTPEKSVPAGRSSPAQRTLSNNLSRASGVGEKLLRKNVCAAG